MQREIRVLIFFLLHAPEWIICFQIPLPCSFPINRFYTLRFDCFKNMPFSYTTWCVNLYAFNSSHKRSTKGDFSSQFIVWDIIYRTYFIYLYHSVFPILNLLKNYNHDSTALNPMYILRAFFNLQSEVRLNFIIFRITMKKTVIVIWS